MYIIGSHISVTLGNVTTTNKCSLHLDKNISLDSFIQYVRKITRLNASIHSLFLSLALAIDTTTRWDL